MSKKIEIVKGCIACGLCLESNYMVESSDGTAEVKNAGIVKDEDIPQVKELILNCPAKVLSLSDIRAKSRTEIQKYIDSQISDFQLSIPPIDKIKYDTKNVYIPTPYSPNGEYDYKYSSSKQAMNEVRKIIDREMYSKRSQLVQNVINDYRVEKLSGYMQYQETDDNFYYQSNKKAELILKNIIKEILAIGNVTVSEDFGIIALRPNSREMWGMDIINDGILHRAESIISELTGEYYTLSSYVDYADWDDMDVYEIGTGMFGRDREVTKYCYKDVSKAYDEIAKDIVSALGWGFDEKVVEFAYEGIENITKKYQEKLIEELKYKADKLLQLI